MKTYKLSILSQIVLLLFCVNLNILGFNASRFLQNEDEIIIIFKGFPQDEKPFFINKTQSMTNVLPRVSFFDSKKAIAISIDEDAKNDTLKIKPVSDFIVVTHRFHSVPECHYIIRKGDIAIFSYIEDRPILHITNRKYPKYDTQYDSLFKKRFNCELVSPIDRYNDTMLSLDFSKLPHKDLGRELREEVAKIKKVNMKLSLALLNNEIPFLDSLFSKNLLSKEVFEYYKNRNFFISQTLVIAGNRMQVNDFEKNITSITEEIKRDLNYKSFLESGFDAFWLSKTTHRDFKDGVNKDYKEAYQMIKGISFLRVEDRDYLLAREIDRIANSFPNKDFLAYFSLFEKDVNDTTYVNYIRDKYALKFNDKKNETNSLVLMSSDKKQITFDDLKKRHAGKLIYVDFWASWCAPCRKALPASVRIKDKNKEVVFVYLSLDSTLEPWKKAMNVEGLSNYAESYLVINTETSNFLKKQNVNAIPRYMIFDKKGVLAFANAPSAESKELVATFEKLLK